MTSSTEDQIHIKQSKDVSQEATPVVRKSSTDHQYMVKHEAEAKQVDRNLSVKELPFRSNHKLVKDVDTYFDDEDEQDDLSAESPSDASTKRSLNGASRRDGGAGSSCHQCKSAKDPSALLFCSSTAEKGVRKRRCRKKYCDSCLKRSYPASLACPQSSDNAWCCPSCLGCCVCAACTRSSDESRHDGMVEGINSLNQLHPQILSYLGVNPDRLAELQVFLAHQSGNSPNSFGVIDAQTQSTLTQLIQTMQAHDSVAKSLHQMLMNQTSLNNGQYFPPGQFEQQNGIIESVNHPANTVPMFTDQTQTMVNPALAFSLNNSAQNASNEWMIPGTPAAKILRAEIDLTATPMQKPMSDQPLNVSPLHQSINISSNSLMNVSPLQPMRNQSYHSVGCSSTGSPSSTATTSSMHSRPVSPAGFSRSIHSSSDQNYSLISSNPTSEMHTLQAQRLSNQAVDQYAHAVVSGHKWSSVDIECEARRHANLTSSAQLHHNQMDDVSGGFGRPTADIEGSSNQYCPAVETRKRAHSACMSDDHVSQHHVSMSRQRVSPPVGIPRSIKNSSAHPRKRSADQAYYPGVAPVNSPKSSQEQLEWEMTRQMQQQSLNQQSMPSAQFSFSPSLNSLPGQLCHPSMQYDLNYSHNQARRFSCAPPFDVDHQQLLGQPGVNQSVLNMEQQLVDPNVAQHSVIRMNQHNQNGFYNSDIPYNSTANHRADVMAPVIQAQDMIQHLLQLNQAQQSAIYS